MSKSEEKDISRIERKKEKRKKKIIEVAMELFRKYGFDETSMERIAEEADIAKGTLYNYFPEKEAILAEEIRLSLSDEFEGWMVKLQKLQNTHSRISFVFNELLNRVQANSEIFAKYLAYRMRKMVSLEWDFDESVKSGVYLLGHAIIELGQKQGEIRDDLQLATLEATFEFVFVNVIKEYYANPEGFKRIRAIDQAIDIFLNGVGRK